MEVVEDGTSGVRRGRIDDDERRRDLYSKSLGAPKELISIQSSSISGHASLFPSRLNLIPTTLHRPALLERIQSDLTDLIPRVGVVVQVGNEEDFLRSLDPDTTFVREGAAVC